MERTYGGLLPAVEGHSLGTRYKVHVDVLLCGKILLIVMIKQIKREEMWIFQTTPFLVFVLKLLSGNVL